MTAGGGSKVSDKRESILGRGDGGVGSSSQGQAYTHMLPLLRDFWRANNERIKGEEAENWLYTHFF